MTNGASTKVSPAGERRRLGGSRCPTSAPPGYDCRMPPGFSPSIKSRPVAPLSHRCRVDAARPSHRCRAGVASPSRRCRVRAALPSPRYGAGVAPRSRPGRAGVAWASHRRRVPVASTPKTAPAPQQSQHSPTSPHPPVRFERSRETGPARHAPCLDFARHERWADVGSDAKSAEFNRPRARAPQTPALRDNARPHPPVPPPTARGALRTGARRGRRP